MIINLKILKILFIILLVAISISIGLSLLSSNSKANNNDEAIVINYNLDYPVSEDLEQMYKESDLIVIGHYESLDSTWNMVRDMNDIMKPDSKDYTEGHLYNFKIEEVLFGKSNKDEIKINLRHHKLFHLEDENEEIHTIEVNDPLFIEPEIGGKYVLFLKENIDFGHYYGALEPYQIKIHNDQILELKSNLKEKNEFVQNVSIKELDSEFVIHSELQPLTDNISGIDLTELKVRINKYKK